MPNANRHSTSNALPKIIHRPDLQSRRQQGGLAMMAGVAWLVWLYLLLPLLTLGGWLFGVDRFQTYVVDGNEQSFASLTVYAICVVLAGGALILWAFYNYRRFRNMERRRPADALTAESLALSYGIRTDEVAQLQGARRVMIKHDEHGNITSVVQVETP